jgi:hypothetical protein
MAKVDLDLVKFVLTRNEMEPRTVARIIEEVRKEAEMQQAENEKPPPVKKQFAILISDPLGTLPEGKDYTGWVLQIPEEDSPAVTVERLTRAAYEFNVTPKGRRMPVQSVGEVCEAVPTRILKEQNVWVKTKEPVLMLRTDNKIPLDKLDAAQKDEA